MIVLLIAAYFGIDLQENQLQTSTPSVTVEPTTQTSQPQNQVLDGTTKIAQAFQSRKSNIQVQSQGRVVAVLKDDNDGSRHQKFILELKHGLTVLVAHNIDLSPRLDGLKKGEIVEFYGEYEYSHQGGVLHWTHHDPQKKHADGWLKYKGRTYQ